jgi:hypothetical protein
MVTYDELPLSGKPKLPTTIEPYWASEPLFRRTSSLGLIGLELVPQASLIEAGEDSQTP